ncbi:MAG: hypothetical protein U0234_08615 [Sandaracinus sp.]|nr:hypothetical protein [Sandaracinaceae bacterium]
MTTTDVLALPSSPLARHVAGPHRRPLVRRASLAPAALIALPATIAAAVLMVLAASLIGPFIMFAIPLMLAFGCAIGPLHALVRGDL